jgi:DUF2075 family protein
MPALLRETAARVKELSSTEKIVSQLSNQMLFQIGNSPNSAEKRSWKNSLEKISNLLVECGLSDLNLLIEYQLPYTSKRIDLLAIGSDPKSGAPVVIAIELKQWSNASLYENSIDSVLIDAYGNSPVLHPILQVQGYCEYLQDFNRFVSSDYTKLYGIAYLHNWLSPTNQALNLIPPSDLGMLFTESQRSKFQEYILSRITSATSDKYTDDFLNSKIAPTKKLMDLASDEIRNREQFTLLDEQQVAYSIVLNALKKAEDSNQKTVVVISGGPGTGKSVIALSLLGELSRRGKTTLHATGSKAFRNSLRKIAGHRSPQVQKLFSYFNSFMTSEKNSLDVLICDEAHRLRVTSANRYTKAELRTGKPQLHELFDVARVPVFLLDSNQVVRKGETGSPEYIEKEAKNLGMRSISINLDGQFRCGGSRQFEIWLQAFLQLANIELPKWNKDPSFELGVTNDVESMETILREKNSLGFKARITAGYCWTWHDPNPDGTLPLDVKIGNWSKPWNVKSDRGVGGYLSGELWAIDPKGFEQVGCVYTAQGFEYDWNGVIFGPDLVWRSNKWIAVQEGSKDPAMRGVDQQQFELLIKNTYKVLLTRGLSGTLICSTDSETQKYFERLLGAVE